MTENRGEGTGTLRMGAIVLSQSPQNEQRTERTLRLVDKQRQQKSIVESIQLFARAARANTKLPVVGTCQGSCLPVRGEQWEACKILLRSAGIHVDHLQARLYQVIHTIPAGPPYRALYALFLPGLMVDGDDCPLRWWHRYVLGYVTNRPLLDGSGIVLVAQAKRAPY